ncbi:putative cell wall-binding protein [Microbacteriaceae bacterium SG_E_30_P1]|uniref:Cell wall-binding protein n=1 Tax=Antiquaquibacter oligotrophicus TaxID=2880260 RepID=A0ABT6KPS8_9MICO|nr:cell wall-binding repeat-containing protein [Antiquaquibacter oligotrophicus]MDH6181996.1 putative cell wall-binding protein [Antiquaquibacter oligotrophicus]UDF12335.1 cell wall-binding repeat-containing protein [Antiquaquibacter oligotrophicus]
MIRTRVDRFRAWRASAIVAALAVVASPLGAIAPAAAASSVELFASPTGAGSDCTVAAPCSIVEAQAAARSLLAADESVTVTLADGRYDLASTLQFTPEDSGSEGDPAIWRAATPGAVTLSGGTSITGWSIDDETRGIWVADVPDGSQSRQLYVDGEWAPIARASAQELGFFGGWTGTSTGYTITDASARQWFQSVDPDDAPRVEFVYDGKTGHWTQGRCLVDGVTDNANSTNLTMLPVCWDGMTKRPPRAGIESGDLPNMPTSTIPSRIENHPSLLSAGEWYLDEDDNKLYYALPEGKDIASLDITLPRLERLVTVAGSLADPVHDIRFEGLQFSYATWLGPSTTGFAEVQSNLHITEEPTQGKCNVGNLGGSCPYGALTQPLANVDVSGSRNIAFVDNTFRALGGAALGVRYGAEGTVVTGNEITSTSSTGLYLGCTYDPQPWDASTHNGIKENCTPDASVVAGDAIGDNEIVRNTTVSNNVIHAVGLDYKAAPGVTILFGQELTLVNNEVFDTPYTAITAGIVQGHATDADNPENNPNVNARNVISNNLLYNYMQYLRDGGAIYVEGHQGQYVLDDEGDLDVEATMANGLLAEGNVAFNDAPETNYTYYDDAGSQFLRWVGNVAMGTNGASQGGCSPGGYIWTTDNYFSKQIGRFSDCEPPRVGIVASGNTVIPSRASLADIPEAVIASAGLDPDYQASSTAEQPQLQYVSDRAADGRVLLAITNLSDDTPVYAGLTKLDSRRVSSTFVEAIVPESLIGYTIAIEQPDAWTRVNETDPSVSYPGWTLAGGRTFGDYQNDIIYTEANGATATVTFTGTQVRIYGEKNADQGDLDIAIDGGPAETISTYADQREVDTVVFESQPLAAGTHTVTITKRSGQYAVIDGYSYIRVQPPVSDVVVDRIAGASRYDVAVNISQSAYPETAPVVYVASGENYPDALSAGPAAASEGGPLLLVRPTAMPALIRAEIVRLNPAKIVVVGGPASVNEDVFFSLSSLADEVVRVDGADRYQVSRNVAEYAFGGADVPLAYLATGEKFPDALTAGGAAGSQDAPVVLVRGSASELDADTAALLEGFSTTDTRVLGGEASVSQGVFDDINEITTAKRLGGADRYQAARAINMDAFDEAERAFLTTGLNFPDALTGSAWAAAAAAPMFVVPGTCVPAGVLSDLDTLGVTKVTLLGGTSSLTSAVFTLTPCA